MGKNDIYKQYFFLFFVIVPSYRYFLCGSMFTIFFVFMIKIPVWSCKFIYPIWFSKLEQITVTTLVCMALRWTNSIYPTQLQYFKLRCSQALIVPFVWPVVIVSVGIIAVPITGNNNIIYLPIHTIFKRVKAILMNAIYFKNIIFTN